MGFRACEAVTPMMENHVEKSMERDMNTVFVFIGLQVLGFPQTRGNLNPSPF